MVRGERVSQEEGCIEPAERTPSDRPRGGITDRLGRLPGMRRGTPRRNVVVGLLYLYLLAGLLWTSTAAAAALPVTGAALATGCPGPGGR
jgi:hypothetical protein